MMQHEIIGSSGVEIQNYASICLVQPMTSPVALSFLTSKCIVVSLVLAPAPSML